jgi:hypothetical protein
LWRSLNAKKFSLSGLNTRNYAWGETVKGATKEDADLLLKLMQMTDTPQMAESMNWFVNEFSARD